MARLMSQIKGGYYAAAPEAVAAVLERLTPPGTGEITLIDPWPVKAGRSCNWPKAFGPSPTALSYPRTVPL